MIGGELSWMAALDAVVQQCRGNGVFASGTIRDTSNRSGRDQPWWSVLIEHTDDLGHEKRRKTAEVRVNAGIIDAPFTWEGRWSARIWQGVGTDSFREEGIRLLPWEQPTAQELDEAMVTLLNEAGRAVLRAVRAGDQT